MKVYELFVANLHPDMASVLMLEFRVYRVTQMYHCLRSEAVREMGLDEVLDLHSSWCVRLHMEFRSLEDGLKAAAKGRA